VHRNGELNALHGVVERVVQELASSKSPPRDEPDTPVPAVAVIHLQSAQGAKQSTMARRLYKRGDEYRPAPFIADSLHTPSSPRTPEDRGGGSGGSGGGGGNFHTTAKGERPGGSDSGREGAAGKGSSDGDAGESGGGGVREAASGSQSAPPAMRMQYTPSPSDEQRWRLWEAALEEKERQLRLREAEIERRERAVRDARARVQVGSYLSFFTPSSAIPFLATNPLATYVSTSKRGNIA
jgi:hypothetical protein